MRVHLNTNREVAQYWAGRKQNEGKGSNFFFREDKLFSWGDHFCVARHIKPGVIAMTTHRDRSQSTREHMRLTVDAIPSSVKIVYCFNPDATAQMNRKAAIEDIQEALDEAALPRIRQPRRDRANERAEFFAKRFNDYLAALEFSTAEPIPSTVQGLRDYFLVQTVIQRLER